MVDVEHGGLRAFEQDALAATAQPVEALPHVLGERQDPGCDLLQVLQQAVARHRLLAQPLAQRVVVRQQGVDLARQGLGFPQVADPDGAAADLVLVGRPDTAARGADADHTRYILAPAVEVAVQRQDQHGMVGNPQGVGRDLDVLLFQTRDLGDEMPGIDHDAVADHRQLARPHHARGQQGQLVDLVADDEGMAGVMAALEAHHDLGAFRQPVHDLALALVAPLGADHCYVGHCIVPAWTGAPWAHEKRPSRPERPRRGVKPSSTVLRHPLHPRAGRIG
jgi:hypothetical protein